MLVYYITQKALTLKRINAIYADNGRGKSTFATLCYSLSTGDEKSILTKQTIGGQNEPEIHFQIQKKILRIKKVNGVRYIQKFMYLMIIIGNSVIVKIYPNKGKRNI